MSNIILSDGYDWTKDLRTDSDGVGYGSIRWVARLAKIDHSGLSKSLKSAVELEPSPLAVFLMAQGFDGVELANCGVTGIRDEIITGILDYYAFEAGRYKTEAALKNFRLVAKVGTRVLIQNATGWHKPLEQTPLTEAEFVVKYLPAEPKKWECRFKADFWAAFKRCYGIEQGKPGCSRFISTYVYKWFPESVYTRLNEINPLLEDGTRKHKLHQHFDADLLLVLEQHIRIVTLNLIQAETRYQFKKLMRGVPKIQFVQVQKSLKAGN